jgi:hypothetical protein
MTQKQMLTVYVMLAKLSHDYPLGTDSHDAIIAAMADLKGRIK